MANSTIKFPQETPLASQINGDDKILISEAATNAAKSATWESIKQYLTIEGQQIKGINPGVLPNGPEGEQRFMEVGDGQYTHPSSAGSPFIVPYGYTGVLWWDGSAWSLANTFELPDLFRDYEKYWGETGYVNKYFGTTDRSAGGEAYRSTFFLRITDRENIVVTGYSGSTNNVALISFYDRDFNFINSYNTDGTEQVSNIAIPSSAVPQDAYYLKASRARTQQGSISGVIFDNTMISGVNEDLFKAYLYAGNGHINKTNGDVDTSSVNVYRYSKFLRIVDKNKIVVTGFSGVTSQIALICFYDFDFNFISSYNSATDGAVVNEVIPESVIPANAVYIRCTKLPSQPELITGVSYKYELEAVESEKIVDHRLKGDTRSQTLQGYVSKVDGFVVNGGSYLYSNLFRITNRNNLVIKSGYSGATNNVALAAFYDLNFKFVGFYNTDITGEVADITVPSASIPESALYVKTTLPLNRKISFAITGAEKVIITGTVESDKMISNRVERSFNLSDPDLFRDIGYIDKRDGLLNTTGASYRGSLFLKIEDKANIRITGYSGVTNNAALIGFFDKNFDYLGFYNSETNGAVVDVLVPESEVPAAAVYIRATKVPSQPILITGVAKSMPILDLIKYADGKKGGKAGDTGLPPRSGRPNVDNGGHAKIVNYLNNDQNIHPKVLFFPSGWNGYTYWMAYTPYPNGNVITENPSIAVSMDGELWSTPTGLTNPLALPPRNPQNPAGFNSDTHLVLNTNTNKLECWWREYNPDTSFDSIVRRISIDGVTWEPKEVIFDFGYFPNKCYSPAIMFENNFYKVWYITSANKVYYIEGTPSAGWSSEIELPIPFGSNIKAWHLDVVRTTKGLEFAIQCWRTPGGTNNTSDLYYVLFDGATYSVPREIVYRGDRAIDNDFAGIYRSSILVINGIYSIYYSGLASNAFRAINLTKGRDIDKLIGVNLP